MGAPLFDSFMSKVLDMVTTYGSKLFNILKTKLHGLVNRSSATTSRNSTDRSTGSHVFHPRTLNFTNVTFSKEEMVLLDRGLKFAPHIRASKKSLKLTVAHTEKVLNFLKNKIQDDPVLPIGSLLNAFSYFKHNNYNSRDFFIAKQLSHKIKELNLILSKADKGNCTVILTKDEYCSKTLEVITQLGATEIRDNPLKSYITKFKTALKNSSETLKYFDTSIERLVLKNPSIPKLYTLPKVHKDNRPHRPIVSFRGSPAHLLSSFLNKILSSHINFLPKYSIKNSKMLCSRLESMEIPNECFLVSFDIVNLFPSVPQSECI